MIIACPHCHTRYQVASGVIGSAGRKVQCAHCQRAWQAHAEPDPAPAPQRHSPARDEKPVDETHEKALDEAFGEAERRSATEKVVPFRDRAAAPEAPAAKASTDEAEPAPQQPVAFDAALARKKLMAFAKREEDLWRRLPAARLRRVTRIASTGLLAATIVGGVALRTEIVRLVPSLAPVYAALGLPVNVIGLDFKDVKTLRTLVDGAEKLMINATIQSVAGGAVPVPPIVVTLTDASGNAIYEWSVAPRVGRIDPGDSYAFETQLPAPPGIATGIRLTFGALSAPGGAEIQNNSATPAAAQHGAH